MAIENNWQIEISKDATNKNILIIGAGPSGLTAAYFLKKYGHNVTVYEMNDKPGGMMRYGVPKYRLPRKVIDAEVKRISDLGVNIVYNKKVQSIANEIGKFDAIYVATGASLASSISVEKKNGAKLLDAIDLFKDLENNGKVSDALGDTVVVYGGGNTAIDAARTALRLGAKNVKIVYRRTINNMPAHESEIQEALSEGIEILCLRTISCVDGHKVLLDKMDYNEESGILSKTGASETIQADSVILAVGQTIEDIFSGTEGMSLADNGCLQVDEHLMTGIKGIFAGGDVIPGKRTITHAIGYGKKAAKNIDAYLRGEVLKPQVKHEVANFKKLNTEYYRVNKKVEVSRQGDVSFEEKSIRYSEDELINESRRCFSCGNCFHCDNCYSYCPDNAIIKHEDGSLEINYDYCKGCGICATECPCGAIKMVSNK